MYFDPTGGYILTGRSPLSSRHARRQALDGGVCSWAVGGHHEDSCHTSTSPPQSGRQPHHPSKRK